MKTDEIIQTEKNVVLGTYSRPPFVLTHGKGVYLFDENGKKYLDFIAGIAVNALGHADEGALKALKEQADKLWHCSNLYYTEPQVKVARLLTDNTFADKVFFCNSGAEAIEGAIKIARKWAKTNKGEQTFEIIAFRNSFHGRTMGAISATGQPKFWQGFEPMLDGFLFATFNDLDSVRELVTPGTCAVLVEPIQGESGIYPAEKEFLQGLRQLCDANNCLLIFDEIQCGLGRTGTFSAYEQYDVQPDIMAVAKPIANGLPMGAILMTDEAAAPIGVGNHGSTFGGGPLVTAVADYVLRQILAPQFLSHVRRMSDYLLQKLEVLRSEYADRILAVRGTGLMCGIELAADPKAVIDACVKNGLLVCKAGNNTLRFLPPLIVETEHIDEAIDILQRALEETAEANE